MRASLSQDAEDDPKFSGMSGDHNARVTGGAREMHDK